MDMWQRAKATARESEVEKGGIAGSILFAVVTLALIGCGILLRQEDNGAGHLETDPFVLLHRLTETKRQPRLYGRLAALFPLGILDHNGQHPHRVKQYVDNGCVWR